MLFTGKTGACTEAKMSSWLLPPSLDTLAESQAQWWLSLQGDLVVWRVSMCRRVSLSFHLLALGTCANTATSPSLSPSLQNVDNILACAT